MDDHARALPINREVLAQHLDPRLALELDRFNLELNLTPVPAAGDPFGTMEREMVAALAGLCASAATLGGRVASIGILPTLRPEDLDASAMTPLPRYRALATGLARMRRGPFHIDIRGRHESMDLMADDVTLEGAGTSHQIHVRVPPRDFADTYNAAQLMTPLAVALAANSPVFLEKLLWEETRIALFKQAVDGRDPEQIGWRGPSRVSFGHGWVRKGAFELFAESVSLFPPLIPVMGDEDPLTCVRDGGVPRLGELRLHHGTVWQWNRAVYDPAAGGHLRIELRALPSGPTPADMATNAAWLLGLVFGQRNAISSQIARLPFRYAEINFYRAAKLGLDAQLIWPSPGGSGLCEVPVAELAAQSIPLAHEGLAALGVDPEVAGQRLGVIRDRLAARTNGAVWQRRGLERFPGSRREALARMLEAYLRHSNSGALVHEWSEAT